jgi:hypothetical protein
MVEKWNNGKDLTACPTFQYSIIPVYSSDALIPG